MRKPLVVANWKMNATLASCAAWAKNVDFTGAQDIETAVCPPFVYLVNLKALLDGAHIALGAQNVSERDNGAFTGEVSASMLADIGAQFVIVGHSERRTLFAETDETVAAKCAKAGQYGLKPILCVGETLAERETGKTKNVIEREIRAVLNKNDLKIFTQGAIAYEPIWAIGTGRSASPEDAEDVHAFIRSLLSEYNAELARTIRILYGGSVKPGNAHALFAQKDIDGGLVGGASLKAEDFSAICRAANVRQ